MRQKRGGLPRAFLLPGTYLRISPANRLIVAAGRPVLEIQNGSRSYQRRHRHRPARRHRRPLAAARPVLRTVRDVGDVRAYAQPDAALTPVSRAYPRLTAHTEFLLELTLMSKPTTLY